MNAADNIEEYFGSKDRNDAWIAEAIWGHRIERQPFSALLLEFLGMAEGMFRQGRLFHHTTPGENVEYTANRCIQLRNILFNNPRLDEILRNSHGSSDEGWRVWTQAMKEGASLGDSLPNDFGYLKERFDTFEEFVNVTRLLRRITVDPGSERSWTTQFIYPIGPAALYEAILEKGDGFERTRRVFTRTGELAYLMVSRASSHLREEIAHRLAPCFDPNASRNKLIMRLISSKEPDQGEKKGATYLPYKTHPAFERLAEDIVAILRLNLPNQDCFAYLQPLLGFHLYLYGIATARSWTGLSGIPPVVCEILAPKSDLVRKAATAAYLDNDSAGTLAVRRFIEGKLADVELQSGLSNANFDDLAKVELLATFLEKTFSLKRCYNEPNWTLYLQKFYADANRIYRNGAADGLTALATGCGLLSKRNTTRYRYAPTDELLRALVLANVTVPMEENAFLRRLHARYNLVIGPNEAKQELQNHYHFDETDFKKNKDRAARHMIGMGLARRKSDSCTYVINPMERLQ